MQATHIREGIRYAVSTQPRKGVSPENLHLVGGIRNYLVLAKGVQRFAAHAKDAWGDPDGEYKDDGIKVTLESDLKVLSGNPDDLTTKIVKPRDVLMTWKEYEQRVEQDTVEAAQKAAEQERINAEREALMSSLRERMAVMGLIEHPDWQKTKDYSIDNFHRVTMDVPTMHRLLDTISHQVYELLSSAE